MSRRKSRNPGKIIGKKPAEHSSRDKNPQEEERREELLQHEPRYRNQREDKDLEAARHHKEREAESSSSGKRPHGLTSRDQEKKRKESAEGYVRSHEVGERQA